MTTGISLVRENALALSPPRSLWVPFPLGRPLGAANNPDFQHRVIAAGLDLLNRSSGPVLEDFAEEAPDQDHATAMACPVSFIRATSETTSWSDRLSQELSILKPWYDLGKRRRNGRTLAGVSGTSMDEIIERLAEHLDTATLPTDDLVWFKHASEDAKTYYLEAMTAQPGDQNQASLHKLLWTQTVLADGLVLLAERLSRTPGLEQFARILVPRSAVELRAETAIDA